MSFFGENLNLIISFAQMVATATGVKNWCQFTFISYYVKNPFREVWRVYIKSNRSNIMKC